MNGDSFTHFVANFVDELVRKGVEHVVISPGSRSTPLAILMCEHPLLKTYVNIDERSAGFFAIGLAKSIKKPVALLCTSGTAAANYYPAVVEAYYSRVPLLVLTADRPHELRDIGAPQVIDQIQLYGKYPKWFVDVAIPEENEGILRYVRTIAGRAVGLAMTKPAGVIHLNFPFREPLVPNLKIENLWGTYENRQEYLSTTIGTQTVNSHQLQAIIEVIKGTQNGLIVCGDQQDSTYKQHVIQLSASLKYPILADPLSQLRAGHKENSIIDCYDTLLKDPEIAEKLKPDVIIRFGAMPVSKPLTTLLKKNPQITQIVIDPSGSYRDTTLNASHIVLCEEATFCKTLVESIEEKAMTAYYQIWLKCHELHRTLLEQALLPITDLFEGKIVNEIQRVLPSESRLMIGNSMPIRDIDTYFRNTPKKIDLYCNRGANGIDGTNSTALGLSVERSKPTFLLVGDLSFYHDLNGLLAAKVNQLDLTIILINNDGGGIFSFLPQSNEERHFETLFGTPIGLDFSKAVDMYGGEFHSMTSWDQFHQYFSEEWENHGLKVIEIKTDRKSRVKVHRDLLYHVSQEIKKAVLS
ncbi:2-succinyl-5-enolpyruvyl-6-hydroxy-3-cyclohexene-1-carboxylic-acid synthase [Bacillus weihaiensis]|uniref:2-succinyl-5-enolpyruvyl-6-hydroxy-3-cyclohexene-1-carboxylate synthase n=1 Tax=Bacillus weihaiensis TaxID=1547283 RepID=A0A1L3MP33_9BACI|nr:2-succinyl-5-enolpyruvyl-6-hydroxy-3-cyclohexene-1-carboxylic-acid synthase [Bacillus weihaiensis]APH03964.1 2-succinyl-5-enolpyruvyl-6-hydroxy-3-cyclohexene-1-carboxylic-acid synthase [Bacillus weihaiensis]